MTKNFDDAVSKHKNNLIESLSQFNEGHRVRGLLMDIESNKSDYEYYFNAGQQSKQAEVDELKNKYDAMYRSFTVADDCRKEWHHCYMGARQREDELQKRIDEALQLLTRTDITSINIARDILKGDSHES